MWKKIYLTVLDLKVAFFCISVGEQKESLVFEMEKSKKIKKSAAVLESSTTEIIKIPTKTTKLPPPPTPSKSSTLLSNIFETDLEQW